MQNNVDFCIMPSYINFRCNIWEVYVSAITNEDEGERIGRWTKIRN